MTVSYYFWFETTRETKGVNAGLCRRPDGGAWSVSTPNSRAGRKSKKHSCSLTQSTAACRRGHLGGSVWGCGKRVSGSWKNKELLLREATRKSRDNEIDYGVGATGIICRIRRRSRIGSLEEDGSGRGRWGKGPSSTGFQIEYEPKELQSQSRQIMGSTGALVRGSGSRTVGCHQH